MRFVALEKLINLHDGYRRRIKIDQLDVLVIQEKGRLAIIQSQCPHRHYPLTDADIEAHRIFCPVHGYGFDLETGQPIEANCAALTVWEAVYEGNEVGIVMGELDPA